MQEVRRMPRLFVEGVKYLWARPFVFGITGLIGAAAFVWEATDIFSLVMIASQWPIGEHGGLSLSLCVFFADWRLTEFLIFFPLLATSLFASDCMLWKPLVFY